MLEVIEKGMPGVDQVHTPTAMGGKKRKAALFMDMHKALFEKFDENQPRAEDGKWTSGGGGSSAASGDSNTPAGAHTPLLTDQSTNPYKQPHNSPKGGAHVDGKNVRFDDGGGFNTDDYSHDFAGRGKVTYTEALDEMLSRPETISDNSPERVALRQKIASDLYGTGAARKERMADIVMGPPGSGKSSVIANQLIKDRGAIEIDSDIAKTQLPEFDKGLGANAVHEESALISHKSEYSVMAKAMTNGDNIVLPVVGSNGASLEKTIRQLNAAGYTVRLHSVEVTPAVSATRVAQRYASKGRALPLNYVTEVAALTAPVFQNYKNDGRISGYTRWDNNGREAVKLEDNNG